jgi:4-hydroxy-tetrahydrodipicolinate reductase
MNIIINGSGGRMGKMIARTVTESGKDNVVAGIEPRGAAGDEGFPVFGSLAACDVDGDVVIDFSGAEAIAGMVQTLEDKTLPVVVATTGLTPEQMGMLKDLAKKVPVFQAANMSLGINLIKKLAAQAAEALGEGFDIELVEKHHNQKKDAPSGTAFALADAINEARGGSLEYEHGRRETAKKREAKELGIHAVRGGTIVGEHELIFAGNDEVITIGHAAYSRQVFATGALKAAAYICGKEPGFYTMDDLISGA